MAEKILVIGARSKVGSELVRRLVAKGEAVKAGTRRPGDYRAAPGVEVSAFDYDESASIGPALQDVDRVFMIHKWTDDHPERKLNRFIEKARTAGVRHVVFLTSQAVDPTLAGPLGMAERHIAGSGMEYTFLHPNWLMQIFTHGAIFPGIRDVGLVAAPAGSAAVSFVDARDVAEVAEAALTGPGHSGQTYELTGGQAVTLAEIADILTNVLGRPIAYQDPSEEAVRSLLHYHLWESENIDHILGLFQYVRMGQSTPVSPTLESLLGRAPVTFEQFARDQTKLWQ